MNTYTKDTERFLTVSSRLAYTILGAWTLYVLAQVVRAYIHYPMF